MSDANDPFFRKQVDLLKYYFTAKDLIYARSLLLVFLKHKWN